MTIYQYPQVFRRRSIWRCRTFQHAFIRQQCRSSKRSQLQGRIGHENRVVLRKWLTKTDTAALDDPGPDELP